MPPARELTIHARCEVWFTIMAFLSSQSPRVNRVRLTAKVSSVTSKASRLSRPLETPLRYSARLELMSRCLRLTKKVVMMTGRTPAPEPIMDTAMNWELPAKTMTDIRTICSMVSPACPARIPKGMPTAAYPTQMGKAAPRPWMTGLLDCTDMTFPRQKMNTNAGPPHESGRPHGIGMTIRDGLQG
ncbi:MAG: hypothetical protein BWX71_02136 [Deltaproteobacteria bacterium ADurb.Bin072]|nr:MAG: hypothetical protein BWX71_02136 [Deltaproteobacteria bacterium ADurb.Bin072]